MSLLRRALGQGSGSEYVETLRGYGYRLGIEIEAADAPEVSIPTPDRGLGRVPRIIILTLVILSLLLLVVVLATAIRQVKRMSSLEGADPERCQPILAPERCQPILVPAGLGDVGEGLAPSRGRPQGPPLHSLARTNLLGSPLMALSASGIGFSSDAIF